MCSEYVTGLEWGGSLAEGPQNTAIGLHWVQMIGLGVFICKWTKWLFSLTKKAKIEEGIWEENSQRSKEQSMDIIYHQTNRQECRVKHTGPDSELWILPLSGFQLQESHVSASSLRDFGDDSIRNSK